MRNPRSVETFKRRCTLVAGVCAHPAFAAIAIRWWKARSMHFFWGSYSASCRKPPDYFLNRKGRQSLAFPEQVQYKPDAVGGRSSAIWIAPRKIPLFSRRLQGRVAQRESTSLTSRGSLVQSQSCPPPKTQAKSLGFCLGTTRLRLARNARGRAHHRKPHN